ncbi:MAG: LysM peptidoglycan-binding domain-containing protein [Opitutus sp.]|nr:LysM peptidoglycan-binding domain-containing protein [Opitutus sp.]MCS6246147.1 LysM peptidoglycan-binding domain-containing protein [Opitutus sp.]MCS6273007.1 LysM peptidoglycan-binding domain-containing protein [Opitutus sp.]MCS6278486.1 LysM peptidoglycan-binding domain-containing protein [Opitutus sp.]MCS6300111.1 LysM peptidoglycan-binding domain-containing protein [Opitutus sp.]
MRFRFFSLCLCALAALLFSAGCGRYDASPFTAEIDEPNYRRGKDLLRQGRNQEALASFLKVVDMRGDEAPESHLEIGILYQQHIKDPIAAIYHYRRFRELKRNSPQSDLVRQRIDAATREFARTLPAQPLDNQMEKIDLLDRVDQLQRENLQLKDQLLGVRTQAVNTSRSALSPLTSSVSAPPLGSVAEPNDALAPLAINPAESPISAEAPAAEPVVVAVAPKPVAVTVAPTVSLRASRPAVPAPAPAVPVSGRRYVVQKGDSLYSIAKRFYGSANNARVQSILQANRSVLPNAAALHPGLTLVIP